MGIHINCEECGESRFIHCIDKGCRNCGNKMPLEEKKHFLAWMVKEKPKLNEKIIKLEKEINSITQHIELFTNLIKKESK